jgi:hypothetical protein
MYYANGKKIENMDDFSNLNFGMNRFFIPKSEINRIF